MKKILKNIVALTVGALATTTASAQLSNIEMVEGKYEAKWNSLQQWECPEWFQDAKFGLWAHWGPQCQANSGDWFGRYMYGGETYYDYERGASFKNSEYGFKEFCRDWKAEKWDPEAIIAKYEKVGAKYFLALANHHDNFDCWDSPYQEWNSVNMGPKRDLGGEWAKAARKHGMKFGMSVHAAHAWTWFEIGRKWGDVRLTKADGVGQWWEGYDPNELYAQAHETVSSGWDDMGNIHNQWNWVNGASIPDEAYKTKLQNRCRQMIQHLNPDMVYFDDTVLPFYGCDNQWGQDFLAYYYNYMAGQGKDVVCCGKVLPEEQKESMLWDVERGIPDRPQKKPWQTDTCIGGWHYSLPDYWNGAYKSASTVIRMLIDIVSKNGNLALSVPLRGDGTYDEKEAAVLDGIQHWMEINGESIYGTRVWWDCFGEGPLAEASNAINGQGFNEGQNYSNQDVRYVTKGEHTIYGTIMAWPSASEFTMKAFATLNEKYAGTVKKVTLLGYGEVNFKQGVKGLTIEVPTTHPDEIAPAYRIELEETMPTEAALYLSVINDAEALIAEAKMNSDAYNTGKYNASEIAAFETKLNSLKGIDTSNEEALASAKTELLAALNQFEKNGKNGNAAWGSSFRYDEDITLNKLTESDTFARSEGGNDRFGKPANWTVENYKVPDGDSPANGTRQGLDKEQGTDMLMLGVWNDASGNQEGDLANARIYRKVSLQPGIYYFGASFEDIYQVSDAAYIFASTKLYNTSELAAKAEASYPVAKAGEGSTLYGVTFEVKEACDMYVGFQANLNTGSSTQQLRVQKVVLYSVSEGWNQKTTDLLEAKGFEKITSMPNNMGDYFYVIADDTEAGSDLLMRLGKGDDKENVFYAGSVNPLKDKAVIWGMEPFDNDNWDRATGTNATRMIFENVSAPFDLVHSEDGPWTFHMYNNCEGWTDRGYMYPTYSIEEADWTFKNHKGGANLGPWDGAGHIVDGQKIAGNKSGNDNGYFNIYAITRGDYMKVVEKLGGASEASPIDVTYLIHNADARQKNNFHSDYPIGWTLSNEGDIKVEYGNYLSTSTDSKYFNIWQGSGNLSNRSMQQTINNLPNGTYRLRITTKDAECAQNAWLFANEDKTMIKDNIDGNNHVYVTTTVTNGTLTIGVELKDYQSNNLKFDEFHLELVAYDAPVTWEDLQELIEEVNANFDPEALSSGTGYHSGESVAALTTALNTAKNMTEISGKDYKTEYQNLSAAYNLFQTSVIEGTSIPTNYNADVTIYELHESDHFARKDASNTNRFTAAKYWTVENYDNVNRGLDNDKGYDCLGMEIWWNINDYSQYDLANARIYQKVTLPEGKYYFGACYPGYEPNDEQYIFASTSLLNTADIPTQSLAYEKVTKAPYYNDSQEFRGITFSLKETQDVYLGWQANMSQNGAYNVRVKGVKLLSLDDTKVQEIRNTNTGLFGTICLPTAADVQGAKLYSTNLSDTHDCLVLTEASSLEPGVAYIYEATADQQTFTLKGETEKEPNTAMLQGFFTTTTAIPDTYVMQNQAGGQKFYKVAAGKEPTMAPYRAYLNTTSNAKALGWVINDETSIDALTSGKAVNIYDLQGRKLNRLQKGINIVNDVKVLVK